MKITFQEAVDAGMEYLQEIFERLGKVEERLQGEVEIARERTVQLEALENTDRLTGTELDSIGERLDKLEAAASERAEIGTEIGWAEAIKGLTVIVDRHCPPDVLEKIRDDVAKLRPQGSDE